MQKSELGKRAGQPCDCGWDLSGVSHALDRHCGTAVTAAQRKLALFSCSALITQWFHCISGLSGMNEVILSD